MREERLVALDLIGPVARERLEKVLAHARAEMDDRGPSRARARSSRRQHDLGQPAWIVGEPGQDRRDADADVDSGFGQAAHGFESALRSRGAGLRRPPHVLVERRNREEHLHGHTSCGLLQHVDVPDDERPAGHDRERRPGARELVKQARVSRNLPSAGWYGSVAVPRATSSRGQDRRASSRRSTSATFVLTRIERP